jgi:hypothetical protein
MPLFDGGSSMAARARQFVELGSDAWTVAGATPGDKEEAHMALATRRFSEAVATDGAF